jgi:hypothetical protein
MSKRTGVFAILDVFDEPETITREPPTRVSGDHEKFIDTTNTQPKVVSAVVSDDAGAVVCDVTDAVIEDTAVDDAQAFLEPEELDSTPAFKDVAEAVQPEPPIVAQIAAWRAKAEAWEKALTSLPSLDRRDGEALLPAVYAFLDSPHAITAIEHGWDARELFGVHLFAPQIRLDAKGLVPNFAWSRLPGPIQIIALGSDEATLHTATGSVLKVPRRPTGYLNADPFWGKDNE